MSLLPLPHAQRLDPFAHLEGRARRLAQAIEGASRRRDVRERRAQIVLVIWELTCPLGGRPRRSWYVPGGTARLGADGIRRAWRGYFGEDPPCLRTIRSHLGALERACVLVRAPGDWLPIWPDPRHPERRPRYADTFYLLDSDQAAEWWAGVGHERLEELPGARHNPDKWAAAFGNWRAEAAGFQLELRFDRPRGSGGPETVGAILAGGEPGRTVPSGDLMTLGTPPATPADELVKQTRENPETDARIPPGPTEAQAELAGLVRRGAGPFELLAGLAATGAQVQGLNFGRLARDGPRLVGAAAVYLVALRRGDRIRNRAAWLVRVFTAAAEWELAAAIYRVARVGGQTGARNGNQTRRRGRADHGPPN